MTEGLVTRIGRWIDRKWQAKATEGELQEIKQLFNKRLDNMDLMINQLRPIVETTLECTKVLDQRLQPLLLQSDSGKEVADLKTRLEKIELYSGMTRKVDPTKPPVVKSAFQI